MRKRLPKARHAEGEAFINAFYRRMSEDELPQHSADGWAALAVDFLDFARARKPGTALVRMFNPTLKSHGWESRAHRPADRQRRHAVPGRHRHDGVG